MRPEFKKGTKVSWLTSNGPGVEPTKGHGICVTDEEDGHVFVADHSAGEKHHVIWCTATWLTAEG